MAVIDNVIDSIVSPQTTGQPIQQVIKDAAVVLGYSGHSNSWETFEPFEAARPDLVKENKVIPVTLSCADFGHMYDIETGGGKNANIGVFMHNAKNVWKTQERWGLQWLYTFASNVEAMTAAARGFGYEQGRDYYVLAAHPSGGKHICGPNVARCGYPKADGTQYLFAGSYDASLINSYMIHAVAPPKPDPYAIFPKDIGEPSFPNKGNERLTVAQTDGALEAHHKKGLYRNYLKHWLRAEIKEYRDRCYRIAKYEPPNYTVLRAHPVWDDGRHLGQRWQALNLRIKQIDAIN